MPKKHIEKPEERSVEYNRLHDLIETDQLLNDAEIHKAYDNARISIEEKSILTGLLHRRSNKMIQRINKREP